MKSTIETFYQAFSELDAETMVSCYHPEIVFYDPAFGTLEGEHVGNMWRMLCHSQQGKDFRVIYSNSAFADDKGSIDWEAFYTFSRTGRKVHNKIHAQFEFVEGKIIRHTDDFNLYRWARQALGMQGALLGWTPMFQKKLQAQTNALLRKFEEKRQV